MAYQKLQAYRALEVIASDTIDIPNPAMLVMTSTTTGASTPNKLIDSAGDFINKRVAVGDIVYSIPATGAVIAAIVTAVDSATELSVTTTIPSPNRAYTIYGKEPSNNGCVLYVGGTGDLKVTTAGGDEITFKGIPAGSFLPVQVLKVFGGTATTATDIIALW